MSNPVLQPDCSCSTEHNIMIDIETLGVTDTAHILSIGLCTFSLVEGVRESDEKVEIQIGLVEQMRSIDASTLNFWLHQDKEVFTKSLAIVTPLRDALNLVIDTIGKYRYNNSKVKVWCNGANFDFRILCNAFAQYNLPIPWQYYEENCLRSIKTLIGSQHSSLSDIVNFRIGKKGLERVPHAALSDAIWQAEYVAAANNYLVKT